VTEDFEKLLGDGDAGERRDEVRPFSPREMVTCEECLRANPPTRLKCFYCGAALPVTETARLYTPTFRQPEKWEEGYNVILRERVPATDELLREVAQFLRLEREEAGRILEATEPLPLARLNSREEARLVEDGLRRAGLNVLIVSDADLMIKDESRRRVRALEFEEDAVTAHPTGGNEAWRAEWSNILLLVTGRLIMRRVETEERQRRGSSEVVETREMTGDVLLLDVYTNGLDGGWRIASDSFDFSCLAERKGFIASQNFATLVSTLQERARHAVVDETYNRMRQALAQVWPPEERTESRGLRRDRPGRFNVEAVMTTDNEAQFTRYSRLRHFLLLRGAQSATE
jgi:hypothetical protein